MNLETLHQRNRAFSTTLPGYQHTWDSTSLNAFTCPRKYQLSIIEGYAPIRPSVDLIFGLAWHSMHEQYQHYLHTTKSPEEALQQVLQASYYRQLKTPLEKIQVCGHHIESIPDGKTEKTARTLLRTFIAYHQVYANDVYHTLILPNNKPATELSFNFELLETAFGSEPNAFWAGHLDCVKTLDAPLDLSNASIRGSDPANWPSIYNFDYKTTTSSLNPYYFRQFTPNIQMSGYSVATQVVLPEPAKGVIVDATSIGAISQDFARQTINRTPAQDEEFLSDVHATLHQAYTCAKQRYWPRNPAACRSLYGDCTFRPVCSEPPADRPTILELDYTTRIWDPTVPR